MLLEQLVQLREVRSFHVPMEPPTLDVEHELVSEHHVEDPRDDRLRCSSSEIPMSADVYGEVGLECGAAEARKFVGASKFWREGETYRTC